MTGGNRTLPVGTLALFLLWIVLVAGAMLWWRSAVKPLSPELRNVLWSQPRMLHSFSLMDQQRQPFSPSNLHDKWTFLFFGYTYCPDICPTTLSTLKRVVDLLRKSLTNGTDVQVVFLSVDPGRDQPEVLKSYLEYFDKTFIGVTGRSSQIDVLATQAGAGYLKDPDHGSGSYPISHSASIFLVNPLGQLVAAFSPPHYPDAVASLFEELRGFY